MFPTLSLKPETPESEDESRILSKSTQSQHAGLRKVMLTEIQKMEKMRQSNDSQTLLAKPKHLSANFQFCFLLFLRKAPMPRVHDSLVVYFLLLMSLCCSRCPWGSRNNQASSPCQGEPKIGFVSTQASQTITKP